MPPHHAVLYQGSSLADTPLDIESLRLVSELDIISVPMLSIGMVREIISSAYARPFNQATKTIVLEVGQIAPEAQQALLKILEEPPATTRFIIVVPSSEALLGTLRSRVYQPQDTREKVTLPNQLFSEFLAGTYSERIALITDIAKAKDTADFDVLAAGVRNWIATAPVTPLSTTIHEWLLLLPKRGSAKKMLWEDIALRLLLSR